jgi:succinoglycan biosynthesis transport protein ExoP
MQNDLKFLPSSTSSIEQQAVRLAPPAHEFSLRDIWKIIRRRQRMMGYVVLASLLLGAVYCALTPKLYRADAQLEILKQDAAAGLSNPEQASATAAADALDFNLALQTHVDVLQSRELSLRVIRELGLDSEPGYRPSGDQSEASKPLDQAPVRLAYALRVFAQRLNVHGVSGTRLLSVSFADPSPDRAAQVVNQLLADFIDHNFQVRFAATSQARSALGAELETMKQQVDSAQAKAVMLQQQSGIYGADAVNNSTNTKLEQINAELTAAEANLALKRSVYNLALTRNPEVLAGMIGAQGTGANTANAPLQLLRQQQADAAAAYAELNSHYGSQYPRVLEAGEKLKSIQASIQTEVNRLVGQATAEYQVALDIERADKASLQNQQALAAQMNHDAIVYTSAKHDADNSRDIYEQLLARLKQAGVVAGMRSSDLNILDPAIPPVRSAQPRIALALLISLASGLLLSVLLLLLVDAFDSSVRDPQRLEELTGLPVLALIPPVESSLPAAAVRSLQRSSHHGNWQYQTTARAPRSAVAEAFRVLRTSLLAAMRRYPMQILAVTSTGEAEGKSFITFNLAAALAQSGKTVLVLDADLRKSALTTSLGLRDANGLDEAIFDTNWRQYVKSYEEVPGLFILPTGHLMHHPADLLSSSAMASFLQTLRSKFDLVIIDTPSILAVTDTVALASVVDAVMVVAKCGKTEQHSLSRTLSVLSRGGAKVLGIIINGISFDSADFYYYWGKNTSGYNAPDSKILSPAPQILSKVASLGAILVALGALSMPHAHAQTTAYEADPGAASQSYAATPVQNAITPAQARKRLQKAGEVPDAPQATVLGVGDMLHISVYDAPELTQQVRVSADGSIRLTLLGDVHAEGKQTGELAKELEADLREKNLIRNPNVSVELSEFATQGVTVEGLVTRPGIYPVYAARSVVDVLAMAGGRTPAAGVDVFVRRHASGKVEKVRLLQGDGGEEASSNVRVFPGDTLVVPRAPLAYVLGAVQRPGGFTMRDDGNLTVLEAISEAQGTTKLASFHVLLLRNVDDQTVTLQIPLKDMQRGKQPDQHMEPGDILFVPTSGAKNFAENTQAIVASLSGAALYAVAR